MGSGEDGDAFQNKGGSIKKRKTVERCGPAEQANATGSELKIVRDARGIGKTGGAAECFGIATNQLFDSPADPACQDLDAAQTVITCSPMGPVSTEPNPSPNR